jgi:hypothetical protein
MSKPSITYAQRCDSTRGAEVAGLANLYSFVLKRSQAKRKAGRNNDSENYAKEDRR